MSDLIERIEAVVLKSQFYFCAFMVFVWLVLALITQDDTNSIIANIWVAAWTIVLAIRNSRARDSQ